MATEENNLGIKFYNYMLCFQDGVQAGITEISLPADTISYETIKLLIRELQDTTGKKNIIITNIIPLPIIHTGNPICQ